MEYLKPFLLGGSIIATSKFVANHVSPEYAALVAAMPTGMIASFFILGKKAKGEYYKGYIVSSVAIALVIVALNMAIKLYPNINIDVLSICSLIVWAVLSFVSVRLMRRVSSKF